MKCLLVDDEPGIREGLAVLLRKQGHTVRTAADCAAASRALLEESDFDAVVTDWHLPDGTAATFVATCPCPVLTVSGRPEDVTPLPAIREVLTKPVTPARLVGALAAVRATAAAAPGPAAALELVPDVRAVVERFVAALPAAAEIEVHDDGTFVVAATTLPLGPGGPPRLPPLGGGDLRCRVRGNTWRAELRLCRDGRPDLDVPAVAFGGQWPDARELAVDFHDTAPSPAELLGCIARARGLRAAGVRVHFLNVPDALRRLIVSHGTAHDMPMSEPVGPRVLAEFADLWSGS
jgi:CheY-like chemotaxis protein